MWSLQGMANLACTIQPLCLFHVRASDYITHGEIENRLALVEELVPTLKQELPKLFSYIPYLYFKVSFNMFILHRHLTLVQALLIRRL